MWRIFFKNGGTEAKNRRNSNKNNELYVPLGGWNKGGTLWNKTSQNRER